MICAGVLKLERPCCSAFLASARGCKGQKWRNCTHWIIWSLPWVKHDGTGNSHWLGASTFDCDHDLKSWNWIFTKKNETLILSSKCLVNCLGFDVCILKPKRNGGNALQIIYATLRTMLMEIWAIGQKYFASNDCLLCKK